MSIERLDDEPTPDRPRSLKYSAEIESRRLLLAMPHIGTGHHFSGAQRESEIGIEICGAVIEFDVE